MHVDPAPRDLLTLHVGRSGPDKAAANGGVEFSVTLRIDIDIDSGVITAAILILKMERISYHRVMRQVGGRREDERRVADSGHPRPVHRNQRHI